MFSNKISTHLVLVLLILVANSSFVMSQQTFQLSGTVYHNDESGNKSTLKGATIEAKVFGIKVMSDSDGRFVIRDIPTGSTPIIVSHIGKITKTEVVNLNSNQELDFTLETANFRIVNIVVNATKETETIGTSSKVSRTAIDHIQANSLFDILRLIPGGVSNNQNLDNAQQITIRNISSGTEDVNAFGTGVIINGSPLSNNANLQSFTPAVSGISSSLSGGASPSGGFDVRPLSVDNIESVEIIRGVPSVEYGDITSGAMIVNTKAGISPWRVRAKTNPHVYQLSANKGLDLGQQNGMLSMGLDYAYNTTNPVHSYLTYQRFNGNLLYSNTFLNDRLKTNTSLDFIYGKDRRKPNPDDTRTMTNSRGNDVGGIFNTNGSLSFYKSRISLKTINYTASVSLKDKESFYETQHTAANAPYSMTYTDGAILTNIPGRDLYDVDGNKITNIGSADMDYRAVYLPSTYLGGYNIDGKELNTFLKIAGTFFHKIGNSNNKWILGADYKYDKNIGAGKSFVDSLPPYRNLSMDNSNFRRRTYDDIPALQQIGLYIQDQFTTKLWDRKFELTAGLRYDNFGKDLDAISPRLNAAYELVPRILTLRGAYGKLAKAPSLSYLSPEPAYFEYVNINEYANTAIPESERVFMTTTRVFDATNQHLKIAQNEKQELGLDLKIGKAFLAITGFKEQLQNGYQYGYSLSTFKPLLFNEYTRTSDGSLPIYELTQSNPVLAKYLAPTNSLTSNTKGIEYELNVGRVDAIRTSFSLFGAWTQNERYSNDYEYYDDQSTTGGAGRTHIGLYESGMSKYHTVYSVSRLSLTHNIPEIGFVVTITPQVIWNEKNWTVFGNDSIPAKYISKYDGLVYDFDSDRKDEPEFASLLRNVNRVSSIKESLPTLLSFDINVTKEIAGFGRVSFFANNMFRQYQLAESDRFPGTVYRRNNPFYFGLELSFTIK